MFWSDDLLTSKKGSLGIIWLAATLGPRTKKITRRQLTTVDLIRTCNLIMEPPEPLALRLSGALLVGVARLFNQNYELFYSDVSNLHLLLRRSIATGFASSGGGDAGTGGVDLAGGRKSKFDQITFAGLDVGWQSGLDLDFSNINWNNPFGSRHSRRSSSKLESLLSQQSQQGKESLGEEEESEDEAELDDDEVEEGREKQRKLLSSPAVPRLGTKSNRTSVKRPSEKMDDWDMAIPPDGLNIFLIDNDGPADTSFSEPSRPAFEIPGDDMNIVPGMNDEFIFTGDTPAVQAVGAITGLASAMKKRKDGDKSEDSVGGDLEEIKKKKAKKVKKVSFDNSLELTDDALSQSVRSYAANMKRERAENNAKEQERAISVIATAMVDGADEWLQFYDPEMKAYFATVTKAGKFKWELDVAASRAGRKWTPEKSVALEEEAVRQNEDVFWHAEPVGEGGLGFQHNDNYVDYMQPVRERSRRGTSQGPDVEIGRRAASQSSQNVLPWEAGMTEVDGFMDLADNSFSPGSRRLSIMTPQEFRIRLSSRQGSSEQAGNRRYRSRSGSLADGQPLDDNLMLAPGDDLELPGDDYAAEIGESQMSQFNRERASLPEAFKPEMLASLEKQCRDFFSYVEKRMTEEDQTRLDMDDLAPNGSSKHVAAYAFHNLLTLATKKILTVAQPKPWGSISLAFTAQLGEQMPALSRSRMH